VIIPEGIEAVVEGSPDGKIPTSNISASLLCGFTLMLAIEQLVSPHSHSHGINDLPLHPTKPHQINEPLEVEFDAELADLDHELSGTSRPGFREVDSQVSVKSLAVGERALALTFGLTIHGLADGLALGVSSLAETKAGETSNLSIIVFIALIMHKAPTALAYSTSLLATSLPRPDCKKHLAVFSASTPLAAVGSYFLFSMFGNGDGGGWTGVALLVSGGTFLYVATVLQPVSHHSESSADELRPPVRVLLISLGMFFPFFLSSLFGHGH